ncbi:MAG: methionine synthase [Acutalibacteraceae bacterium]
MIKLEALNLKEAARYMGIKGAPDKKTEDMMRLCEKKLLLAAQPKYVYRFFEIDKISDESGEHKVCLKNCELQLCGRDICAHLQGCFGAVLLCATISAGADLLIRRMQVTDMAQAVILDSLASTAVEQVCNKLDDIIRADFPDCYTTWRFSPGYGDLPLDIQAQFLKILDAPKKTGVCVGESMMLTPFKSVTAVIGVSKNPLPKRKRGCAACNMRESCNFRKAGTRCV